MSSDKCLALIFSLMILGQAYWVRRVVGTWLFPACLFGLFWFGYTFFPLVLLLWMPVQPYAVGFIFLCTLAFSAGSVPFDWKKAFEKNAQKRERTALVYGSRFLKVSFYVSTLGSLVSLALNLFRQGISVHDLIFDLYSTAAAYADLVFSDGLNGSILERSTVICAYLGAILGGLLFPFIPTKKGRRFIVVLSFLPSIFAAVGQSSKGLLFLCIVFFYAGLLVSRVSVGNLRLFEKASIKSLAICLAVLIAIVTISFMSRGLYAIEDRDELRSTLIGHFASYSCGHIYAFSDWFSFTIGGHSELTYPHENATYGFYTFAPVFRLLGSNKVVPQGYFDDYYSHGEFVAGNIYTMFRGLIQDFGFVGSIVFMLATSLILHWAFRAMLDSRTPVFTVAVFVFMVGYFYNSFIISFLNWSNVYLTFILVWVVLSVNNRIQQRAARQLAPAQLTAGLLA